MGRKSNRKKNRFENKNLREQEEAHQKKIAYLILLPGVALFIWGIVLFDKTFISNMAQVIITLIGATIGITIMYFIWRHKKFGLIPTFFFGFFLGGPIPYCFIATTNYYFRAEKSEIVDLDIIETGNRSSRKSKCRTPFAVIEHLDIKKDILFPCDYEKTISSYKNLTLTVSEGFWGYTVYLDKKLND